MMVTLKINWIPKIKYKINFLNYDRKHSFLQISLNIFVTNKFRVILLQKKPTKKKIPSKKPLTFISFYVITFSTHKKVILNHTTHKFSWSHYSRLQGWNFSLFLLNETVISELMEKHSKKIFDIHSINLKWMITTCRNTEREKENEENEN